MTPASQQLVRRRSVAGGVLAVGLGALALAALFLPSRDPGTHALALQWRPSAELAGLLFLVALAALAGPRLAANRGVAVALSLLVCAAAALNLADAATPSLLGRDLNLYWDLRHWPSLVGLARESAGALRFSATAFLAFLALSLVSAVVYGIWRRILIALSDRRVAIGAAVVIGIALDVTALAPAEIRPLATGFARDVVRQAAVFEQSRLAAAGGPLPAALVSAGPPASNLAGLKQQDVYLVFIESYGTTVFDTPDYLKGLQGSLALFESAAHGAGYAIASSRVVSPTFGGGSWLAHATLASGVRLDDPVVYAQLLGSGRKLLPGYFKDAGWRAVAVMPGVQAPSPEGKGAGFDREVFAAGLGYHGPSFGWFAIPDQFTLQRVAAIRSELGSTTPVFTQIVLVSSHIPFSPVPPYLADWADSGLFATVPAATWNEIYRQPDWTALAPNYLKSLRYDFAVLGDWLAKHLPGNALIILLGDHQPPAMVGGELKEWTVPIHVLSRDRDLVAPFIAAGYVDGMIPTQGPPHRGMEDFLPSFLAAYDRDG